jgi:hypothetical protein
VNDSTRDIFRTCASVLLWCWIFGFVLLFVWTGAVVSGIVYRVHGPLMELSRDQLEVIHYCGLGLFKLTLLTLFFIPWLAIRLVLRKK